MVKSQAVKLGLCWGWVCALRGYARLGKGEYSCCALGLRFRLALYIGAGFAPGLGKRAEQSVGIPP